MSVAVIVLPQPWFLGFGFFLSSKSYWHSHQQKYIYLQDFETKKGVWVWVSYPEQLSHNESTIAAHL